MVVTVATVVAVVMAMVVAMVPRLLVGPVVGIDGHEAERGEELGELQAAVVVAVRFDKELPDVLIDGRVGRQGVGEEGLGVLLQQSGKLIPAQVIIHWVPDGVVMVDVDGALQRELQVSLHCTTGGRGVPPTAM